MNAPWLMFHFKLTLLSYFKHKACCSFRKPKRLNISLRLAFPCLGGEFSAHDDGFGAMPFFYTKRSFSSSQSLHDYLALKMFILVIFFYLHLVSIRFEELCILDFLLNFLFQTCWIILVRTCCQVFIKKKVCFLIVFHCITSLILTYWSFCINTKVLKHLSLGHCACMGQVLHFSFKQKNNTLVFVDFWVLARVFDHPEHHLLIHFS